jgi:threonine/homoserine/homoserine lactone efflux protein
VTEALVTAVGIAASPFAVIPAVLLLFSPRAGASSSSFAAGWAAGVGLVTTLAVLLADLLTLPDNPPSWASWTRVVLGAALVLAGLAKYLRASSKDSEPAAWMRSLEQGTPRSALRFGLLASGPNPKVALLAVAGGFSIGAETEGAGREALEILVFTAVAASTAVLPALAHLALGERALRPLGRVKDWLTAHNDLILTVVLVVIGVLLLWKGVSALSF